LAKIVLEVTKKLALIFFIQSIILFVILWGMLYYVIPGRFTCDVTHEVLVVSMTNDRNLAPPINGEWVDTEYVAERLLEQFPEVGSKVYFKDSRYLLVPMDQVERLLNWDGTDEFAYVSEQYDCDNYELRLWGQVNSLPEWAGISLGMVWFSEPAHALNFFVDVEGKVWLIEPQSDTIFEKPQGWEAFLIML